MRKVRRWRYYCEYCKKSSGSAFHMAKHEKSCVSNPDRSCGFCDIMGEPNDLEKLKAIAKSSIDKINALPIKEFSDIAARDEIASKTVELIIKESGGCPACTLAAINQNEDSYYLEFDYKKAKEEFWNEWSDIEEECY